MMRLHPREFFGLDDPSERAVPQVPLALLLLAIAVTALDAQRSYSIERFDARILVNKDPGLESLHRVGAPCSQRSEEQTSEIQSPHDILCRLPAHKNKTVKPHCQ